MPDTVITPVASHGSASTLGCSSQIKGRAKTPKKAVKTISTAVSLCRKYLSTRNLSIWVETAHNNGPEKAKSSHIPGPAEKSYFGISTSLTGVRGAVPLSITKVTARCTGGL